LPTDTKIYWRVDEVNGRSFPGSGTIYKGDVWCFTTRPAVLGLFVDIDAAGANNGSSWADAFNHLQDALSIARSGDEIHVAQGTYKPDLGAGITPGDRNATFQLISGVTVKGGYAGFGEPDPNARDIELYETILTGDLSGNDVEVADPCDLLTEPTRAENSYHVVSGSGTDDTTVVDCFTITSGNANGPLDLPHINRYGAGVHIPGSSSLMMVNCTITCNSAIWDGGGMYIDTGTPTLIDCIFSNNSAGGGGGLRNESRCSPTLTRCVFNGNSARTDGGGMYSDGGMPTLTHCSFIGNSAAVGGGMTNEGLATFKNCLFIGNKSVEDGGGLFNHETTAELSHCTFYANLAGGRGGGIAQSEDSPTMTNCILWANNDSYGTNPYAQIEGFDPSIINYNCIQGWSGDLGGIGNIGDDPLFVDADGIDNIVGTDDDNLRLLLGSPCIDAGDNSVVWVTTDLDGNPRIRGSAVDMGAYEACTIYHVDGVNGDNTNDGLTRETAFKTIQRGINAADDSEAVLVWPGVYNQEISFRGDEITVKSAADAAIVETNYGYAFSFSSAEGPNTVLSNFIIRDSQYGIYLINGSSPILRNLTIVNNDFGISAFNGSDPDISNCILWGNYFGDLFREPIPLQATYSCIEEGGEGEGNISIEPGFVDANGGDYHLLSERGRYWPAHDVWVLDEVTSPCVDGGDPAVGPGVEPMPNGGRINMGAYGNTAYASMSEWPIKGDINHDGRFNFVDIAILLDEWLAELDWAQ
ncbi:MAG: right-handed parallel beta-helix repeat-containing protein, partial [Planctomycetota bacterium]